MRTCSRTRVHQFCSGVAELGDFPGGSDGKASVYNAGGLGLIPGSGRFPEEGNRKSHGRRSLVSMGSQRVGHNWVTSLWLWDIREKKKCFALFFPFAFLEEAHPPSNAIGFTIFSEKHCCLSSPLGGLTLSGNEALLSELCSAPGCPQESSPGLSSWLEESVACSQEPGQSGKSRLQLNRREWSQC